MSRPASVKTAVNKMLAIEHPLSKMAKENTFDNTVNNFLTPADEGRSLAFEDEQKYKPKKSMGSRSSSRVSRSDTSMDNLNLHGTFLTNIPESIAVVGGDANLTRMPLFGNRSNIQSRNSTTSRHGSAKEAVKLSLEEISEILQNKLEKNYYEVRKKFIDNDPDRKGNVQKEALMRIIQQIVGCEITTSCLNSLFEMWGIKSEKQMLSFNEIYTIFVNKSKEKSETSFFDPVNRHKAKAIVPAKMTATDAFDYIKEKFRSREMYLTDLFPDSVESQAFSITKADLKNSLYKIMIDLLPPEMEKLWLKFDQTKQGSIDSMKFLKQIGIISYPIASLTPNVRASNDSFKLNLNASFIEKLLKTKLREGFTTLRQDFQKKDTNQTGFLSISDFIQVLSEHDLKLEESNLGEFLSRCIITPTKEGIPYKEFLIRFQDRSEAGITHKLLTDRDNKKSSNIDSELNPVSLVEFKLVNLFQKDFLEILENFRKFDKYQNGSIELKDFKKVLENQMNVEFTESQFKVIVDNLPLNRNQTVPYLDFLKQFDTGNFSSLSFNDIHETSSVLNESDPVTDYNIEEIQSGKTVAEIKTIMKQAFDSKFGDIEKRFNELDEYNGKVLTPELMFQLMKTLDVKPELSRGDIRSVWKTFILNEKKLLDFKEFTRHFMYNKSTASFPNAKLNPPVKGDSDLMQRSRKLNAATDILMDNLRAKIDLLYNDLLKEFTHLDPENNGAISVEDFQEIIKELSIHLTDHEIRIVTDKFKTPNNKIAYLELLKPFCSHKSQQILENSSDKKKKLNSKKIDQFNGKDSNSFHFFHKLQAVIQSAMIRNIKKIDYGNTGFISIAELRALLLLEGVSLSEDEVFNLMNSYDKNLNGSINYKMLLQDLQSKF